MWRDLWCGARKVTISFFIQVYITCWWFLCSNSIRWLLQVISTSELLILLIFPQLLFRLFLLWESHCVATLISVVADFFTLSLFVKQPTSVLNVSFSEEDGLILLVRVLMFITLPWVLCLFGPLFSEENGLILLVRVSMVITLLCLLCLFEAFFSELTADFLWTWVSNFSLWTDCVTAFRSSVNDEACVWFDLALFTFLFLLIRISKHCRPCLYSGISVSGAKTAHLNRDCFLLHDFVLAAWWCWSWTCV